MKKYIHPTSLVVKFQTEEATAQFIVSSQTVATGEAREMDFPFWGENNDFKHSWEDEP